uniref:Uncharacterized protein n=1 Tax=Anopheles christyi TaxID=43041 RepID=A0A182JXD2_9DIPT
MQYLQPLLAAPIFWFLPWSFPGLSTTTTTAASTSSNAGTASTSGASNSSNVSVAIGNRVNTSTGLDDYGTNITNVQINVNRMRRAVTGTDLVRLERKLRQTSEGGSSNDTVITIGEHTIRLPANISNLTVNTYLINGIPNDDGVMLPDSGSTTNERPTNSNEPPPAPLLSAIRLLRNFFASFFGKEASQT